MGEFDAEIYDIVRQIPPGRLAPGWPTQRELLEHEGVTFRRNGWVELAKHLWEEIAPIA